MRPSIDNLVVTFVVGNEAHVVVGHDLLYIGITFIDKSLFLGRDNHVGQIERKAALEGHLVSEVLDVVEELGCTHNTAYFDDITNDGTQRLLGKNLVDITHLFGNELIDENTTHRGIAQHFDIIAVLIEVLYTHLHGSMQCHLTFVVGNLSLLRSVENETFALGTGAQFGNVVQTQDHILRRHGDRGTVGGVKDIVGTKHQHLSFENSLVTKRQVHGHLVTIEVGIEGGTSQGVQLNGFTLNHFGLESLDTETVQSRGTVEEYGVSFHHVLENIPYNGIFAIDDFLRRLPRLDDTALDELADNKRFIELGCHVFGQTAFIHFQFRTYHDNRTGRVVDTFTEKILTETSLLTFQTVGERFQRTIGIGLHSTRLTRVVEQRVDSLLQHTFLIAENHLRSFNLHQTFETIVANDYAAIKVVEVGGGKTSAVEGYQRTQLGRNDGNDFENHPLGPVAVFGGTERLNDLQPFECFVLALLRTIFIGRITQFVRKFIQVETHQQVINGLGTHLGDKLVGVGILKQLIVLGERIEHIEILLFREKIIHGQVVFHTGLYDDITLIIDNCVEFLRGKSEQITYFIGQ